MKRVDLRIAVLFLLTLSAAAESRLRVVEDDALWQKMVHPSTAAERTAEQRGWAALIRSRATQWESEIPKLETDYAPVTVAETATIVIGNGGGEDAFTYDATTIGFDAARLQKEYGDATTAENAARIDRFFRHEYTHLLQKAWLAKHPYDANTPLRAALLGIWKEGLGNYHSLSEKWRGTSAANAKARAELEPRFVARLAALGCASSEQAGAITYDLSMGRFDQKWGALPVALWLEAEPHTINNLVRAGPDGIWILAERHLPPPLRTILYEARAASALCAATSPER